MKKITWSATDIEKLVHCHLSLSYTFISLLSVAVAIAAIAKGALLASMVCVGISITLGYITFRIVIHHSLKYRAFFENIFRNNPESQVILVPEQDSSEKSYYILNHSSIGGSSWKQSYKAINAAQYALYKTAMLKLHPAVNT